MTQIAKHECDFIHDAIDFVHSSEEQVSLSLIHVGNRVKLKSTNDVRHKIDFWMTWFDYSVIKLV